MKKTAITISAALTAFTLLILSGVIYSVKQNAQAEASAAQPPAPDAGQPLDPDFAEREAAYQALIEQANLRLEQAQLEIQRLQAQSPQAQPQGEVSLEQAAQVAAAYTGQSEVYSAERVAMDGQAVYRVTFSSGDVVLVSPAGQVLDVQPASRGASFSTASSIFEDGDDDEHEEEHEEDEDEDHEDDDHDDEDHEDDDRDDDDQD